MSRKNQAVQMLFGGNIRHCLIITLKMPKAKLSHSDKITCIFCRTKWCKNKKNGSAAVIARDTAVFPFFNPFSILFQPFFNPFSTLFQPFFNPFCLSLFLPFPLPRSSSSTPYVPAAVSAVPSFFFFVCITNSLK